MHLVGFIARRLLGGAVIAAITSFVVYAGMYFSPTSPLNLLAGGRNATAEQIAAVTKKYHLDAGLPEQYWRWVTGVFRGDLGESFIYHDSVSSIIAARVPTTLMLIGYTALLIVVIGIGLGVVSGFSKRGADQVIRAVFSFGISVPGFVAATTLIATFAVAIPLFPSFGAGSGFGDRIWHLTLPAVALALSNIAYVGKITRSSVLQNRSKDFVWAADARGIRPATTRRRSVLRNALLPVFTVCGLTIAGLLAGSVVIETVFSLDGLGSLLIAAITQKDFALVQMITLILVTAFVLMSAVVDVLYGLVDPRVRERLIR